MSSREMLDEYFALLISTEGELESLPLLLNGSLPDINQLPLCRSSRFLLAHFDSNIKCGRHRNTDETTSIQ